MTSEKTIHALEVQLSALRARLKEVQTDIDSLFIMESELESDIRDIEHELEVLETEAKHAEHMQDLTDRYADLKRGKL